MHIRVVLLSQSVLSWCDVQGHSISTTLYSAQFSDLPCHREHVVKSANFLVGCSLWTIASPLCIAVNSCDDFGALRTSSKYRLHHHQRTSAATIAAAATAAAATAAAATADM